MAKKPFKRVVVISDLHCGHRVGLTPPQWQLNPENEWDEKWGRIQAEQWDWYKRTIQSLKPIHLLLVMGDAVDGTSPKASGRDVSRYKQKEQVAMAEECILLAGADNIEMVFGTRYHVSDWEEDVARHVGAKIGGHGWATVTCPDGPDVVFDVKHKVGGSQTPYTRGTSIGREEVWNLIWAEAKRQPRGDVFLRGHVHYFEPKKQRGKWLMTCPALQGVGTEYGSEQCTGTVDFGLIQFQVFPDGRIGWEDRLAELPSHKAVPSMY